MPAAERSTTDLLAFVLDDCAELDGRFGAAWSRLGEILPPEAHPDAVLATEAPWPMSPNGKVDRAELLARWRRWAVEEPHDGPQLQQLWPSDADRATKRRRLDEADVSHWERVHTVVSAVLPAADGGGPDRPPLGRGDYFVALGGTSIAAERAVQQLVRTYQIGTPRTSRWRHANTIADQQANRGPRYVMTCRRQRAATVVGDATARAAGRGG